MFLWTVNIFGSNQSLRWPPDEHLQWTLDVSLSGRHWQSDTRILVLCSLPVQRSKPAGHCCVRASIRPVTHLWNGLTSEKVTSSNPVGSGGCTKTLTWGGNWELKLSWAVWGVWKKAALDWGSLRFPIPLCTRLTRAELESKIHPQRKTSPFKPVLSASFCLSFMLFQS